MPKIKTNPNLINTIKQVTLITGPLRSGTSCVIGLLEQYGFNLGENIRVLRRKTQHNPMGHFELDLLFTINNRLLVECPGNDYSVFCVPEPEIIAKLAARRDAYFTMFVNKFDGNMCKDPLMCLTLPYWKKHWPNLTRVIYCLRHPVAVACSIEKRYQIKKEKALELWHTYTKYFFKGANSFDVFIFDFDLFCCNPEKEMTSLLSWLNHPLIPEKIQAEIDSFFIKEAVHSSYGTDELESVPDKIKKTYLALQLNAKSMSYHA
jgi:hypothetical protein